MVFWFKLEMAITIDVGREVNMGISSRKWIEEHREDLKGRYDDKTVIVSGARVVEVLEGAVDPIEVNRIASEKLKGKDWSYTYVCKEEEYLL